MTWAPVPGTPRVVLTPEEEQRWRQWYASQPPVAARLPAALEQYRAFRAQQAGLGDSGDGMAAAAFMALIALYVGTTVASYYLVRDIAPKKSAKSYGSLAVSANLIFPIVGPVIVGLVAANDKGKR